ncbi:MAG: DUF2207 domain-containing protein [Candidatus Saccharimonadales bacterium]
MKRFMLGLIVVALISITTCVNFSHATVNDFIISNFTADYYLDKDASGRSTLKTVESITAEFPEYDQNHGIERALVSFYDGHSTSLKLESITDQDKNNLSYTTYEQNDNLVLRIGNADTYVHGKQTYLITYTQKDTTKFFSDTNDDEFYWDVNGTGWYQYFSNVTARLHLGDSVVNSTTDNYSCYYGVSGSDKECNINRADDLITATWSNLAPGENMTIAVGFNASTFIEYQMTAGEFIERYAFFFSAALGLIGLVAVVVLRVKHGRNDPGRGIVVAEYLPPSDADVALSSVIFGKSRTWVSAMMIDLAVRHKLKIIEKDKKKYTLELIALNGISETESSVIKALFGGSAKIGDKYEVQKNKSNTMVAYKLTNIYRAVKSDAQKSGYYLDKKSLRIRMVLVSVAAAMPALVAWMTFTSGLTLAGDFLPLLGIAIVSIGILIVSLMKPLSRKGRDLFDYLKGLDMYINVAEKDRLKVLQSPQGAEKTPVDIDNKEEVLHLYERVLPYAVLFGSEKEWTKTLGEYYEQQNVQPDWYSSNGVFNAVLFSSAFSNFSSNMTSNTYYSSSSSSSGGSSGGGFSGGGGGGGGGGGW